MTAPKIINLAASLGEMPSGGDVAQGRSDRLTLTVEGVLSWTDGMHWGIRIEKSNYTPSGRKGKPEKVLFLVCNEGQSVPDLLRSIAHMWDLGEVETGKPYPAPTTRAGIAEPAFEAAP